MTLRSFRESNGGEGPEFEDEKEDDRERVEAGSKRSFQKSMKSFSDNFDDITTFPGPKFSGDQGKEPKGGR